MKKIFINISLLLTSTLLILIVLELFSRLYLNPVDYLSIKLEVHPVLVHVNPSYKSSHDAWGFRNKEVPQRADIVTIGDSQTYGVSAIASQSWPAQLEEKVSKKVYNLSLGGYGPCQYYYLFNNNALKLKPSLIIVGFYYGNDIFDTFKAIYHNPQYWKKFRTSKVDELIYEEKENHNIKSVFNKKFSYFKRIRVYLSQNSVLYRIIVHGPLMGRIKRILQLQMYQHGKIVDRENNIYAAFTPGKRIQGVNLNDIKIRESLNISLDIIKSMHDISHKQDIRFLVVLIPTKESVYSDFIYNNKSINDSDIIDKIIENEKTINGIVTSYLKNNNINYIETLPNLKKNIKKEIYPVHHDDHPNKNGYNIIAQTISDYITLNNLMDNTGLH
jgi:lysophospholipase L1-like esterase